MGPITIETASPRETEDLGLRLAGLAPRPSVIALYGDLATGKTCLVRGMAAAFSQGEAIHSPTFTLVNQYGEDGGLCHMDLYRLGSADELADLGYEELFDPVDDRNGVRICVVEWAERAEGLLPEKRLDVRLEHAGGDRRRFTFEDRGVMPSGWTEQLGAPLGARTP